MSDADVRSLLLTVHAVFHVCRIAQFTQPILIGGLDFLFANHRPCVVALAVSRHLCLAAAFHLDQVHTELALHRLRHIARLELVHRLLEFRHQLARRHPAQLATRTGRPVLRIAACRIAKIVAVDDPVT